MSYEAEPASNAEGKECLMRQSQRLMQKETNVLLKRQFQAGDDSFRNTKGKKDLLSSC